MIKATVHYMLFMIWLHNAVMILLIQKQSTKCFVKNLTLIVSLIRQWRNKL